MVGPAAPGPLEEALFAHLRHGAVAPAVAPLVALDPEAFWLLRSFSGRSDGRARVAARVLAEALSASPEPGAVGAAASEASVSEDQPPPVMSFADAQSGGLVAAPLLKAALRSAEDALMTAAALEDALGTLSPWALRGHHPGGSPLLGLLTDRVTPLADRLARLPRLTRLVALLGRLAQSDVGARLATSPAALADVGPGVSRVRGLTFGASLPDVLSSDRLLLADPDTELRFAAKYLEQQLLQLQWHGSAPRPSGAPEPAARRGPVLLAIDTSGSMLDSAGAGAAPVDLARAVALLVLRRVLAERRHAHVILFGGDRATTGLDFRPGRVDHAAVLAFLSHAFGGGTEFGGPLGKALALRASDPRFAAADVALVSDGIAPVPLSLLPRLEAARRAGMRLAGVAITRPGQRATALEALADPLEKLDAAAFSV